LGMLGTNKLISQPSVFCKSYNSQPRRNYSTKVTRRHRAITYKDIPRHACTRLSPRTSRCVGDSACSTASCELASAACHWEPLLYPPLLQPPYRQCSQSDTIHNQLKYQKFVFINLNETRQAKQADELLHLCS